MKKLLPDLLTRIFASLLFGLVITTGNAWSQAADEPASESSEANKVETPSEPERWFTVELITFTRERFDDNHERWPLPTVAENTETSDTPVEQAPVNSVPATDNIEQQLIELNQTEFQLSKQAYSIGRSPNIRIQSHQAWRLPGQPIETAPWLMIDDSQQQRVTGRVKVSLARFLHADFELLIQNPEYSEFSSTAGVIQQAAQIHFTAHRRLRSGELHYIDHPLAGVLIKIEKFQQAENTAPLSSEAVTATPEIQ
ncbi:MAG: CsiV family protein [Chromatiales bacterium]|jgi:hypothetical protein